MILQKIKNTRLYTQIGIVSFVPVGRHAAVSSRVGKIRSSVSIGRARVVKRINTTAFQMLGISLRSEFRAAVGPVFNAEKPHKTKYDRTR